MKELKKDFTQKQVAEAIGISEVFVRKIEKGLRNPGRETMLKFEQLSGIAVTGAGGASTGKDYRILI